MKTLRALSVLASISIALVSSTSVGQGIYWQDNFDSLGSPITATASGTVNGYDIKYGSTVATEDFRAIFGFDYSAVTYPIAIPSAPNSSGSTRGLFLTVNKDATAAQAAVNLYPVGQSFSGDYKLKFDVWMNWTNLATSTEQMFVGINHSGTVTNRALGAGSDGLMFSMSGDGGNSGTSTTARDFGLYAGQGAAVPLLLRTNVQPYLSFLAPQFDQANPGAAALFPSKPIYGGTPAGSAGLGWVQGEVRQEGTMITYMLDGAVIGQYNSTNAWTSGNIMIGYFDVFNSLGDLNNFAIFDNIVVSTIPEPTAAVLVGLGITAMVASLRRRRS